MKPGWFMVLATLATLAAHAATTTTTTPDNATCTCSCVVPAPTPVPCPTLTVTPQPSTTPTVTPPPSQPVITDKLLHAEPALPALPAAGGKLKDPVFGTTILRVTGASDGAQCEIAYSYWPTINKDSSKLLYRCDNALKLAVFDAGTFTVGAKEALPRTPSNTSLGGEDTIWAGQNINVLYGHDLKKLWQYNSNTKVYTLIADLDALLGTTTNDNVQQMSKSDDDNLFAWTVKNGNYSNIGYAVYSKSLNKIIYRKATSQVDEVQLDKSGRYLVVKTGVESTASDIRVIVVDLTTGVETKLTNGTPDFSCGHSDNGIAKTVGIDNWNNTVQTRNLSTPHSYRHELTFPDWSQAAHVSMLATNENWVVISTYGGGGQGPFHREIFQVSTDGSQRVRRLAHHRSSQASYETMPKANISRDGRFIAFTSDWGGSGRRDVFIVQVPLAP